MINDAHAYNYAKRLKGLVTGNKKCTNKHTHTYVHTYVRQIFGDDANNKHIKGTKMTPSIIAAVKTKATKAHTHTQVVHTLW